MTTSPTLLALRRRQTPLFLDRNQGTRTLPDLLRSAGLAVELHQDYFSPAEPDHLWIPRCAANGWIIVTSDKRIETDPINRQAIIDAKARLVLLDENNSRGVLWAAAIIVSQAHIYNALLDADGPCVLPLRLSGNLTGRLRIIESEAASGSR